MISLFPSCSRLFIKATELKDYPKNIEWHIVPQYDYGTPFIEGVATINIKGCKGAINKNNKRILFSKNITFINESRNGIIVYSVKTFALKLTGFGTTYDKKLKNKWMPKQTTTKETKYPKLERIYDAKLGYGYADSTGKILVPLGKYAFCLEFSEGLANVGVRMPNNLVRSAFIDVTGKIIIEPGFGMPRSGFSEGLCAVQNYETNKWSYIDKTGKIYFQELFDDVSFEGFSEGVDAVCINGKWGYIKNPLPKK